MNTVMRREPLLALTGEFRLGYTSAYTLDGTLAQRGEWTIASSRDGTRYSRIHPTVIE